jgi:hypothetical protein
VGGAAWPVTVDPLLTSPPWTAEGGQAGVCFGTAVASAGDVNGDGYADVIVGANQYDNGQTDEGRAFVYHGSAVGLSTSVAWSAEGGQENVFFGNAVASAGDVNGDGYADVIVGADHYDNPASNEGRAFVYHGSAAGLSTAAAWTAEGNQAEARFGYSVASAGDVNSDGFPDVIVGAYAFENGESAEGRAYVYHGSSTGLSTTANWTGESNLADACFGYSVASAGDVNGDGYADVIIGAYGATNGQTNEGRAYVYQGSSTGLSTTANWTGESNMTGACYGYSVASAGDVNGDGYAEVVIGAYLYDNGQTNEGRAYVYHGSAAGVVLTAGWNGEGDAAGAFYGTSVACAGDVNGDGYDDVIVGADLYDGPDSAEGRAFVYHGSSAGLQLAAAWTGEANQAGAWYGYSVAAAGDIDGDGYSDVIVGVPFYDNGETSEGRAYVYYGSAGGVAGGVWTVDSRQYMSGLGWSVASAGDVNGDGYADVIVGAHRFANGEEGEGAAWLYHGSAQGPSTTASWNVEGSQASAGLGSSVASAGDVNGDGYSDVIVGAHQFTNGVTNEGRAYVYHGSASGLSAAASWSAEGNQLNAQFGNSVASAGDVNGDGYADVIVGAFYYDNVEANEGRAFVYHGSASGLAAAAGWTAEANQDAALFGASVASAGDVNRDGFSDVIIGANLYDNGQSNEGRAYVYHGSASGLSTTAARTIENDQADSEFGNAVASAGDVNGDGYADVIVGSYHYDNGQNDEGRAYVYHGSSSGIPATASWTVESNEANAAFGYSVASAGDVDGDGYADVVVSAPWYGNGQSSEGGAFLYRGSSSGLPAAASWTVESNLASSYLGMSVASAGDVNGDGYSDVIAGASEYEDNGRAYVFYGAAGSPSSSASWTAENNQADARFGRSVASAGDVNGDGYTDVIIGAPYADNGETNEGRAYVYHGTATGLSAGAAWTAESNLGSSYFGYSVASAGDVNGDGYGDVIVGADTYSNGQTNEGRAFVFHGSASGLSATASWTAEGDQANAMFGHFVASAGDVNGDGYGDVIVGAYVYDNGHNNEGRAYVYHGSASGLASTAAWSVEGNQTSAQLGCAVASAGDVNGDGYGDVIVGALGYNGAAAIGGRALVYHGSASGLSATAAWTADSDLVTASLGVSVASAGDVNGDGYADVIVGAYGTDHSEIEEGAAYVWLGSPSGVNGGVAGTRVNAAWSVEANVADRYRGWSVAGAGDVNGDGFADVLVGEPRYANGQALEGRALVHYGSTLGLLTAPAWAVESNQANAYLGTSVACAGDVNGDGFADLIVGSDQYDNGEGNEGRAFAFYGNGGNGRPVVAQQLRPNGTTPVQPWGSAGDTNELYIRARHSSPFGRDRVQMQVEACPAGTPFGSSGCVVSTSSTWTSAATAVLVLRKLSLPQVSSLYRWRERTLRAPYGVSQAGITPPPNPAHGPWRRVMAQAFEADIRTGAKYNLTVTKLGAGTGVVTSSPAGINCGAVCAATYDPNTLVTLAATADAGSVFTGWYGGCYGTGACQITMANSTTVFATFNTPYSLTVGVAAIGSGTITSSPAGISCGGDCAETYAAGTWVELTANPAAGSSFAGWTGGGCTGVGECQVQMTTAHHVWGVFVPTSTPTGFYPITPCRALDTRLDSGSTAAAPILAAGSRRDFSLVGKCGLPSGVKAISANLTVVGGAALGDLRVIASHVPSTNTSALSIPISRARANNAIVQLSVDGLLTISALNPTTGSVHFILDINGYFL